MERCEEEPFMKRFWIRLGSFAITLLSAIHVILYQLDNGIILKTTSQLFNQEKEIGYRAWDLVFGLTENGKTVFEPNRWGMIGFVAIGIAGLIALVFAIGRLRFLLSFILAVIGFIITALLPQLVDLKTLDWGDLLTIKPIHGIPLIIALICQGIIALLSASLYSLYPIKKRRRS